MHDAGQVAIAALPEASASALQTQALPTQHLSSGQSLSVKNSYSRTAAGLAAAAFELAY